MSVACARKKREYLPPHGGAGWTDIVRASHSSWLLWQSDSVRGKFQQHTGQTYRKATNSGKKHENMANSIFFVRYIGVFEVLEMAKCPLLPD